MKKLSLCLLFIILLNFNSFAQTITVYNQANSGLSVDRIRGFSNVDGDIWVGEGQGCSRFDGTNWENFSWTDIGAPWDWINIYDVVKDNEGEIWAASDAGVFNYDGISWTRFGTDNTPELSEGSTFLDMKIDTNGIIWLLGTNTVWSYLYSLDPSDMTWTVFDRNTYPIFDQAFWDMHFDSSGKLILVATNDGFIEYDGSTFISWGGNTTFGFDIDGEENYWSGDHGMIYGLYKYDAAYNEIAGYTVNNSLIPFDWIFDVEYSHEAGFEGVWFSGDQGFFTPQGVGFFDEGKNFFVNFNTSTGLIYDKIDVIHIENNQAWLGTFDAGVMVIDFAASPFLSVDTGVVVVQVPVGASEIIPLNIINKGAGDLDYSFDLSNTASWLSSANTNGTVNGTGSIAEDLTYDATGFTAPTVQETTLRIFSNGGIGALRVVMEVVDPTSVNEYTAERLKVYPNPASSILTIDSETEIEGVKIFNLSGQCVYDSHQEFDQRLVDISGLAKGQYSLRITTNTFTQNTRFVKL